MSQNNLSRGQNYLIEKFGYSKAAALQYSGMAGIAVGILLAILKGRGFLSGFGWYLIGNIGVSALMAIVVLVLMDNKPPSNE